MSAGAILGQSAETSEPKRGEPRHSINLLVGVHQGPDHGNAQILNISRSGFLPPGRPLRRLAAFQRVQLDPGETRTVTLEIDPRLLADWDEDRRHIRGGRYRFALGTSAKALGEPVDVVLPESFLNP
ncbi:fibronectin type III-like domain-contianing protein [Qipengyuania sp.]|uniref:fibronectin type III-like domain-contianing protein n=1 Tax=Qipengyuania sp. TaxID=2004515 RepID=UPI003AF7458D